MTLVKYTSRQLLAKIPDSGTFTAEDIDTTDVLPRREALGGAITTLARAKLIRKCGSNPVRYIAGARRNVWELTDLGRYHKARGAVILKKIIVYTKPNCSGCNQLKAALIRQGIEFTELDGTSAVGLSALRCAGCFPMYYPVLQVGERIYEWASLFDEKGNLLDLTEVLNASS